jgi:serine/threonine-protein kinase HipA
MSRDLDVYLYDTLAGALTQDDNGSLSFLYDQNYLGSPDAHQISISMPLMDVLYPDNIARPFFSGLLPDERARRSLANYLGISAGNAFGLLEAIGGECAGALAFYPKGIEPPRPNEEDIDILDDDRLLKILGLLHTRPLMAGEEGIRLSLAGVQDKLAVCLVDNKIALAKGGALTTHILKPIINHLSGTVENEVFCMTLAKRMKLEVPVADIRYAGDTPYYLVERYDRTHTKEGRLVRLHQEDFCQAVSVPPELKYEDEGGPGVGVCLDLLQKYSSQPALDRLTFIRMLIFNYLIGNADAHAKNYAFLYKHGNAPTIAPAYDMLCTAMYPRLSKKLAMKIGNRDIPDTIHLKQWSTLVSEAKTAQRFLESDLKGMASQIGEESDRLIEELVKKGTKVNFLEPIRGVIKTRAKHVLSYWES